MGASAVQAWVCPVCGYIHYGSEPPEECPVCGAMGDLFEPYEETAPAAAPVGGTLRVVIAGAGIAGVSAAEALRKAAPAAEITLVSNEPDFPYYRLNLTRYLAGEVSLEQLALHPQGWYEEHGIRLVRETEVCELDAAKKEMVLSGGQRLAYDRLLLAGGANPFMPPFAGVERRNVTTLRTRRDADRLLEAGLRAGRCVCIGGGLLGLETAGALARRGVEVTVLEDQGWLLPRQLNETGARLFLQHVQSAGIQVRTQARTRQIAGDGSASGVELDDGTQLPAGLVVISTGVRSNVQLARAAGLQVQRGIVVDDALRTSHPDIFAAGDIAEHQGVLYGIWAPSQLQGGVAGLNLAGQAAGFSALPGSHTLKVLGYDLFSIGQVAPAGAQDQALQAELEGGYACFIFHEQALAGAILLGDTSLSPRVKKAVEERLDCSALLRLQASAQDVIEYLRAEG